MLQFSLSILFIMLSLFFVHKNKSLLLSCYLKYAWPHVLDTYLCRHISTKSFLNCNKTFTSKSLSNQCKSKHYDTFNPLILKYNKVSIFFMKEMCELYP